jgi:hypothetical protein
LRRNKRQLPAKLSVNRTGPDYDTRIPQKSRLTRLLLANRDSSAGSPETSDEYETTFVIPFDTWLFW